MTRAVLYARVSTADQSADMQLHDLRAAAAQRGWDVVAELTDVASGAKADLPGRARALELARLGRVDVVAVWRLDRLGRSVRDLVAASDALREARVELVSLRDAIDTTTPAGRMMFHVLAAVAELEREMIRERVVAGIARAKRLGVKPGRPRKFVSTVRAEALLAAGRSVRSVARELEVAPRTLRRRLADEARREAGRNPGPSEGSDPAQNGPAATPAHPRGET